MWVCCYYSYLWLCVWVCCCHAWLSLCVVVVFLFFEVVVAVYGGTCVCCFYSGGCEYRAWVIVLFAVFVVVVVVHGYQ